MRGANTGFQDAQALAWRLALVARGVAPVRLLDSYSGERVGAAREIVEEAGKSTRFMAPPSRGFRLLRDAVLSLSLTQQFVRPLYHWRTSRPHEYAHSPLNSADDDNHLFEAGPGHGAPPLNLRLGPMTICWTTWAVDSTCCISPMARPCPPSGAKLPGWCAAVAWACASWPSPARRPRSRSRVPI